ncbi:AraC family transcriptional regulator [Sphingobacterium psychroaquaticum]|uniref:helix-turn-helix domain-containing protein n=1 Tax=Sphingobacterium psychroaquaticum TaxID=561061 RepID=UPI001068DD70|nr:AraC family transcriptional regulator [Sphingobacterium psychroaquaticum]QBQ41038.1 AraC family transcriptional regulator [Sphingobacterium psychroaquaticum]
MEKAYTFDTIHQYNVFNNHETLNPLVSVIDFSKAHERTGSRMTFGLYCIFVKDIKCGDLKYGCNYYDYEEGTLVFISPGQVIDVENKVDLYQPKGYGLVFHPDLIKGTALANLMDDYHFFSYNTNEALHLSAEERKIVFDCFAKIEYELSHSIDKHSKKLIASNIELFLNYCERFYDRQFITRENANKGILEKFEQLLNTYFNSENPYTIGLPTVAYFADELHLSANYFGDLIKKETGKSAQDYIQNKTTDIAKTKIQSGDKTINEIAYELGFKYPQHFSRLFKNRVGMTPNEYRNVGNN